MLRKFTDGEFNEIMNRVVKIYEKARVDTGVTEGDFRFILENLTGFGVYSKDALNSIIGGSSYYLRKRICYFCPGRTPKNRMFTEAKAPSKITEYFKWTSVSSFPGLYRGKLNQEELGNLAENSRLSSLFLGWARAFIYFTCFNGVWPVILVPMVYAKRRGMDFSTAMEYSRLMNPELTEKLDKVYMEAIWHKVRGIPFNG